MNSYRPSDNRRPVYRDSGNYYRPRDRSRSRSPPRWSSKSSDEMYHFRGSRDREPPRRDDYRPRNLPGRPRWRSPPRQPYRRPAPPPPRTAANRALFRFRHDDAADTADFAGGPASAPRFRDLNELTDSEEEDMNQTADEDVDEDKGSDNNGRGAKRVRLEGHAPDAASVPKWSNPDPYTSLPAGITGQGPAKRTDVVKLIRKARVDSPRTKNAKSSNDFISFDDGPDSATDKPEVEVVSSSAAQTAPLSSSASMVPLLPPTPPPTMGSMTSLPARQSQADTARPKGAQPPSRKRKRVFELGDGNDFYSDDLVTTTWYAISGTDSAPWLHEHPSTDLPGVL
jgi:non-canonical poly(A) RNA polymerase PAPD5/7